MTTEGLAGDIRISAAETPAVGIVAEAVQRFQEKYPRVRCHFVSADAYTAAEHLRSGLSQFGVFNMPCRLDGFEYIRLPRENRWGVLTRRDGVLAGKTVVTPEDLKRLPLYVSKQRGVENRIGGWLNYSFSKLRVVGTYNLLYNASLVVRAGGNALCLDGIVPPDDDIVFLPFQPAFLTDVVLAWSSASQKQTITEEFLKTLRSLYPAQEETEEENGSAADEETAP